MRITSFLLVLILAVGLPTTSYQQHLPNSKEIIECIQLPEISSDKLIITNYGAIGDGITDCKKAFDLAIQKCKTIGGGKIVVPPGQYLLKGPLHFVNNMELHLQKGATLKFSSNPQYYLPLVKTSWEGTLIYNYSPFIYAVNKNNIAVTGKGIIDGESSQTWSRWIKNQRKDQRLSRKMNHKAIPVNDRNFGGGHYLRPQLIQFFQCKNILMDGIHIEDAPFWCIHCLMSKNIIIRNLSFDAQNGNNDGIDLESSENILIEDIHFDNNNDNIAIKAGRDHEGRSIKMMSKNIVIRNCLFKGANGIAIGSEISGGVENIFIENCGSKERLKRAIYIKSNKDRGGEISHISFKNLQFGEVEDCIYITSNYKNEGRGHTTPIHNIIIDDLMCEKATRYAIYIKGFSKEKISNLYLKNIRIKTANQPIKVKKVTNIQSENIFINSNAIKFY